MELQIQNEKIDIKKNLGNKIKTVNIEKDFILPDNKPDIIKVQNTNANAYIVKIEKMENKIRIEGGMSLRITYLTGEGKNRVLKTEETFNELVEFNGVNDECFINSRIDVSKVNLNIINERKIHIQVEGQCQIKASRKESIEFIYEINPAHQLQTLNRTMSIDTFIGHGESKINVKERLDVENLQENIEVIKINPEIRNIEKKMSYNKVLVKADCMINCLYITEAGMIYITKKEVPVMGFLDINNVEDSNECNIDFMIKNISAIENQKEVNSGIDVEIEFNVIGDVYQEKEIKLLEDLYGLNSQVEFLKQKVVVDRYKQNIVQKNIVKQKMLVEDINQIYDIEFNMLNTKVSGKYIESEVQAKCLYSSFENLGVNNKEEIFRIQLTLEKELSEANIQIVNSRYVLLPDSSIDIELEVIVLTENANQEKIELIKEVQIEEECNDDGYSMIIYFVKQGDSLWNIAKRFKSTVNEIVHINDITNEEKINVGDKLYIPRAI